jgi:hypothetical protein
MRETSLRWGLGLGAVAAVVGIATQLVAAQFLPHGQAAPFDVAIRYLIVAAPLVLLAVGLAVGLAYLAGLRAERDRPPEPPRPPDAVPPWGGERRDSALAGTIVMAAYWLLTSLYALVLNMGGAATFGSFLSQRLVQGILFLAFGYGMGALGGRAPAARKLLDSISVAPADAGAPDGTHAESATGAEEHPAPVVENEQ